MEKYEKINKPILDVCCGSRMFYFQPNNENVIFMDNRELSTNLCDGRSLVIKPDIIADFRNIPFQDNTFKLVVFDPPHLLKVGDSSWLCKKYGKLKETWPNDLKQGFKECMRVLQPYGVLIFKWNETDITLKMVLDSIDYKPLFGDKRAKTNWLVFIKEI
jgi:ubiquinone/menaquinone biosynthesis C-methylase UbiE